MSKKSHQITQGQFNELFRLFLNVQKISSPVFGFVWGNEAQLKRLLYDVGISIKTPHSYLITAKMRLNEYIRIVSGVESGNLLQRFCGKNAKILTILSEACCSIDTATFEKELFSAIATARDTLWRKGGIIILLTENAEKSNTVKVILLVKQNGSKNTTIIDVLTLS